MINMDTSQTSIKSEPLLI